MRHPRLRVALVTALLAVLVLPSGAAASRPATPEENAAFAALMELPVECLTSVVSTPDSTWAATTVDKDGAGCRGRDEVLVMQLVDGAWTGVYLEAVDSIVCPLGPSVPGAIARDLGVCPDQVYVASAFGGRLEYKPTRMLGFEHALLKKLRWSRWGSTTGAGKGTFDYRDSRNRLVIPVKVVLSNRGRCGDEQAYRRIRITAARASDRPRLKLFSKRVINLRCPA
jgi:hypothetical protein